MAHSPDVYPVYRFAGFYKREYIFYATDTFKALDFAQAYNKAGVTENGCYLAPGRPLPEGRKTNNYRGWNIDFSYGYFTAHHDNYDASWEGDENGWVDNGLSLSERTLLDLIIEIEQAEMESATTGATLDLI